MKRILITIIILTAAWPIAAQWKTVSLNGSVLAFGVVYDTILFASVGPDRLSSDVALARYTPGSPSGDWTGWDNGINLKDDGPIYSFAYLGSKIFAGPRGEGVVVWVSSNNGDTWGMSLAGSPIASNGRYLFGGYTNPFALLRSKDTGKTWDSVAAIGASSFGTFGSLILAGTANGVWRSTDNGLTWDSTSAPFGNVEFAKVGTDIIAANDSMIESTDSGLHWQRVPFSRPFYKIASDSTYLFAGTDSGVYVSLDKGMHWFQKNQGLPPFYMVSALCVFDTFLFVNAEASDGEYYTAKCPISFLVDTTTAAVRELPVSDSVEIYPNPTSGMVTIMSGSSILGVVVTDVLGTDVYSISKLDQQSATLDLSHIVPGAYFIRIRSAAAITLKKLSIVR